MKRILTALVLLTGLFGAGGAVWAGDSDPRAEYLKLRKAAEKGDTDAMYRLASKLELGAVGVTQDLVAAHMWYNIYHANTDGDLRSLRFFIERKMSRGQIAKAQERASRCMESKYKDCEAEPKSWWQKLLD
jgi:hypothetical protein